MKKLVILLTFILSVNACGLSQILSAKPTLEEKEFMRNASASQCDSVLMRYDGRDGYKKPIYGKKEIAERPEKQMGTLETIFWAKIIWEFAPLFIAIPVGLIWLISNIKNYR